MRQRTGLLVLAAFLCLVVFSAAVLADSNSNVRARVRRAPATNTTTPPGKATGKATPASNVTRNATTPKPAPKPSANVTANKTAASNQTVVPVKPANATVSNNTSPIDGYPFPNSSWFNAISRVQIARVLEASAVITDALFAVNHTVNGLLKVNGSLEALSVVAMSTRTKILETKSIRSPTGTVVVDGDLQIINSKGATEAAARRAGKVGSFGLQATAFLAEEVVVSGVKQWRLVRHDSFEQEVPGQNPAEGWSLMQLSSCSRNAARDQSEVDHFLGGHCNIAEGELKKKYEHLPPHKHVRLSARYHMIDNWQGETAFLKIGEEYVWSDRSRASSDSEGLDTCGSEKYAERRMSVPIDVVIPHSASFLEVAFGSTALSKNKGKQSPCDRSFGVDDVMVYVR